MVRAAVMPRCCAELFFWAVLLTATPCWLVQAHDGGLHGRQGFDPPALPVIPDITSIPFEISVTFRFRDWYGNSGSQTVFDFGNGVASDNVMLRQVGEEQRLEFLFFCAPGAGQPVSDSLVSTSGTIHNDVTTTWKVGVDASGVMYITIDGVLNVSKTASCLPSVSTNRANKYLGESHSANDEPMIGSVLGLSIRNPHARSFDDLAFLSIPSQNLFFGGVIVSMYVRFDSLTANGGSQHVFDFSGAGGAGDSQYYFAQVGTTANVEFVIQDDSQTYQVEATNAIVEGEFAFWHVGRESGGKLIIQKNDTLLASLNGYNPISTDYRPNLLIGESIDASNGPLDGVVLGLRVD